MLFPAGDGREEAIGRRSKTIPKTPKNQPAEFYIGKKGTKRKAETAVDGGRKTRPNPGGGNQKLTGKRKAVGQPDGEPPARRMPPKPEQPKTKNKSVTKPMAKNRT